MQRRSFYYVLEAGWVLAILLLMTIRIQQNLVLVVTDEIDDPVCGRTWNQTTVEVFSFV